MIKTIILLLSLIFVSTSHAAIDIEDQLTNEEQKEYQDALNQIDDIDISTEDGTDLSIAPDAKEEPEELTPPNYNISALELFVDPISNASCTNYCFEGTCFWLKCTLLSCSVKTSLRVSHRNPDLVVSSYPLLGDNPWKEFRMIWGSLQESVGDTLISWIGSSAGAGGGQGTTTASKGGGGNQTNSTIFREVDVVGYYYDFGDLSDDLFCHSNTIGFLPYYSSAFDGYFWRVAITDLPNTWRIWTDVIGSVTSTNWGSLYLRTGFVKQLNPAKANAVLSMRGASIASSSGNARVYIPATGTPSGNQKFFEIPSKVQADGSDGSAWQMRVPDKSDSCVVFDEIAENENPAAYTNWTTGKWDGNNESPSVYNLWRPYECCKKKGQFLYSVKIQVCI